MAFSECWNLTRIEFYSYTISSISSSAFSNCANKPNSKVKGINAQDFINTVRATNPSWFTNWSIDA
jgi:hypothetical protein